LWESKEKKKKSFENRKGKWGGGKMFLKVGLAGKFRLSGTTVIPKNPER